MNLPARHPQEYPLHRALRNALLDKAVKQNYTDSILDGLPILSMNPKRPAGS